MEFPDFNDAFHDFLMDEKPQVGTAVVFQGKLGILLSPQFGEFILSELRHTKDGLIATGKELAYLNYHDHHG